LEFTEALDKLYKDKPEYQESLAEIHLSLAGFELLNLFRAKFVENNDSNLTAASKRFKDALQNSISYARTHELGFLLKGFYALITGELLL
jgi:hypothetical protein